MTKANKLLDSFKQNWGWWLGASTSIIIIVIYCISFSSYYSSKHNRYQEKASAFYEECLQDREHYECDALWGSAYKLYWR